MEIRYGEFGIILSDIGRIQFPAYGSKTDGNAGVAASSEISEQIVSGTKKLSG